MIGWMLQSVAVGLVVTIACLAADLAARLLGRPTRFVWAGGLALTVVLSAASAWSIGAANARGAGSVGVGQPGTEPFGGAAWPWTVLFERLAPVGRLIDFPVQVASAAIDRAVAPEIRSLIPIVAGLASLGLTVVLIGVQWRIRTAWRGWPVASVLGSRVRVAHQVGPFVIGVWRPEIVVPRWLLDREIETQRLVILHEGEHLAARDPLLLSLGWLALVLTPWIPTAWYGLARLRLAVELDCDARVLRRGVLRRSYGSVLIDVAQRVSTMRLGALALIGQRTQLSRRIVAMTSSGAGFRRLRASGAFVITAGGVLVACQSRLPPLIVPPTGPVIIIDGVRATDAELRGLEPSSIESVDVLKGHLAALAFGDSAGTRGVVTVKTKLGRLP